jgi:hypothetical protein
VTVDQERAFWIGLRRALIEVIRTIELRYGLESAIVTNEQRKRLRRTMRYETEAEPTES